MCDYCSDIKLVGNIKSPQHYEEIIKYMIELVENMEFVSVDGNCELGCQKQDGKWVDDIIYNTIKCPKCNQKFTCSVNTYRGGGQFSKG